MLNNKSYIGTNFDNFLKEENIEITSEEIKRNAKRKILYKDMEYIRDKIYQTILCTPLLSMEMALRNTLQDYPLAPNYPYIKINDDEIRIVVQFKEESECGFSLCVPLWIYEHEMNRIHFFSNWF